MINENEINALKKFEAEIVEPYSSLIENFRALGYTLPDALADIIDNSIAAEAANVWIEFRYANDASFIIIRDDGHGMSRDELVEALRPGVENPLAERHPRDLGRFGLGLKSASFSQCRRLTVISKRKDSDASYRTWDLDYIQKCKTWQLLEFLSDPALANSFGKTNEGTIVLWEKPDRIIYGHNDKLLTQGKFLELVRISERHLAMVFHRYIEKKKIRLFINERVIEAWDPFLHDNENVRPMPEEPHSDGRIVLKGYVLPYASKISPALYERAAGPNGWTAQQGFYIYRRERMLVAGDWMGLFRKTESTRLARIMVDIDPSLDHIWQIDIRKSKAIPPGFFREQMKRYAGAVREVASEVYNHRGQISKRKLTKTAAFTFAWIIEEIDGRQYYRINRQHPLVLDLLENASVPKKQIKNLLLLLETTLPILSIFATESNNSENDTNENVTVEDEDDINELLKAVYNRLKKTNKIEEEIMDELYRTEPLGKYPHLIEAIRNKP